MTPILILMFLIPLEGLFIAGIISEWRKAGK